MERALIMLKPDGVKLGLEGVLRGKLEAVGLNVIRERYIRITANHILQLHPGHDLQKHWPEYLAFMTSGPVYLIVCEGENANAKVVKIKGTGWPVPCGIRGKFASSRLRNVMHSSESPEEAEAELAIFANELGC